MTEINNYNIVEFKKLLVGAKIVDIKQDKYNEVSIVLDNAKTMCFYHSENDAGLYLIERK